MVIVSTTCNNPHRRALWEQFRTNLRIYPISKTRRINRPQVDVLALAQTSRDLVFGSKWHVTPF